MNRATIVFVCVSVFAGRQERAAGGEMIVNSIDMKLVRVEAGEFMRGSPARERGRRDDETQARVRISKPFSMGQRETTRGQFRTFVKATGFKTESERNGLGGYGYDAATNRLTSRDPKYTWRETGFPQTDEHPVVNVTWNDAAEFCRWLSAKEQRTYRLPTEAEWEYACRGGSTTAFCNGDDPEQLSEVGNIVDASARRRFPDRIAIRGSDGHIFTARVASFKPNALGIYDMHGNVWEWCADWFGPYPSGPHTDPRGPADADAKFGFGRVIRGGDWYHDWSFARSAQRYPIPPNLPRRHGGFRVVLEEPSQGEK
jgi:formylglycine-generating enzyme required for sulfatase activity